MKKTSCIVALFLALATSLDAQMLSAVSGLKDRCYLSETTKELFNNPSEKSTRLKVITVGNYGAKKAVDSLSAQAQNIVPVNELVSNIWLLVSKQLEGNAGTLSTKMPNWFLTKTKLWGVSTAMVRWDKKYKQWDILVYDIRGFADATRDVKLFYY